MNHRTKSAVVETFRRDTILDAARRVIARHGIPGASMDEIARQAKVAKGTLYLYFRDRDDLIERSADRVLDELLARSRAVLESAPTLRAGVGDLVRAEFELFDANLEFWRVYLALNSHERIKRGTRIAKYVELLTSYLADAVKRGEMRPLNPEWAALFLVEGVGAVLKKRMEARNGSSTSDADCVIDLLLDGLCPKELPLGGAAV